MQEAECVTSSGAVNRLRATMQCNFAGHKVTGHHTNWDYAPGQPQWARQGSQLHLSIHATVNDFQLCGNRPGPLIRQAPKQACSPESSYGLELVVPDPLPGFCHLQAGESCQQCHSPQHTGAAALPPGQERAYSAPQYTDFWQQMHMHKGGQGYVQVARWERSCMLSCGVGKVKSSSSLCEAKAHRRHDGSQADRSRARY